MDKIGLIPAFIYVINIISIIILIFVRKKDMSTTFAWLLVLIFIPIIGFIFYFFFGSTYKLTKMFEKFKMKELEDSLIKEFKEYLNETGVNDIEYVNPRTKDYQNMVTMNKNISNCLFSQDNNVELLINGQGKFPRMFSEIESAKESINVLYFIIKSRDEIGIKLIDLLARKAKEGVKVKVVYDSFGWTKTKYEDFRPIIDAGGEVQKFLPSLIKTLIEINYRLHRKVVIIDGKVAYTGGINVGDDYLGLYPKMTPWRDTSVRITGSAVKELQIRFFLDWIFLGKQDKKLEKKVEKYTFSYISQNYFGKSEEKGSMGIQIVSGGPDMEYSPHKDCYTKLISDAKSYIYMQTPYLVPDQTLLDSLRIASESGVDVRIMIPGIPDKAFVYYVSLSYVQDLLEAGIRVFKHSGFLHAKTFVIDDYVSSVGTTNFDIRSFHLDYEINTLVFDENFAKVCKNTFLKDSEDIYLPNTEKEKRTEEIILDVYKKRGNWKKFSESLCRFLAPLA